MYNHSTSSNRPAGGVAQTVNNLKDIGGL